MADAKETKPAAEPVLAEVKLALGKIDHIVYLEKARVVFTAGIAKVEKDVQRKLKEIGIIE